MTFIQRIKAQTDSLALTKKTTFLFLSLIVCLAGILRWYHIGTQSLWFDELVSAAQSRMDLPNLVLSLENDFQAPLYYFLLHYWVKIFGISEIALRSMSFVLGLLTIPMIYLVGKELINPFTGLMSALLLSLSSFHIYFSQETRSYCLIGFLTLISFHFFIMIVKRGNKKQYIVGFIITNVFLLYTHSIAIFILLTQNIIWFIIKLFKKKQIGYLQWTLYQILSLLLFTPWLLIEINQLKEFQGMMIFSVPNIYGLLNTFYQYSGSFSLLFLFCLIFLLGLYSGFRRFSFQESFPIWSTTVFLLIWIGFPILVPFILSQFITPIYNARNTLGAAFGFYILMGKSLTAIKYIIITTLLFFVMLIASAQKLNTYYSVPDKEQWREAVEYVDRYAQPGDMISIIAPAYEYYNKRYDLVRVEDFSEQPDQQNVSSLPRLWVIKSTGEEPGILQTIKGTFTYNKKKDFFRVSVSLYTNNSLNIR